MANLPWFEDLHKQLARHHLPHPYIKRFLEELTDHIEDLKEETMSTEADVFSRLGNPADLAQTAAIEYCHHSFLGRHSTAAFLVFAVSPLVLLISLITLAFFGLGLVFWLIGDDNLTQTSANFRQLGPIASMALPYVLSILIIIIPSVLASILYCILVKKVGIGRKWMFVSCVMLAAMASTLVWTVRLSDEPGQSRLALGLLYIPHNIEQLVQIIVPLAIGWWFMRRKQDQVQMVGQSINLHN